MKQRVVWSRTPRPKVTITTTRERPEAWDTLAFETISPRLLQQLFRAASTKHRDALLQLAISRLALDSEITTVQDAITSTLGGTAPIEIASDGDNAAIDKAYSTALRLYVYNHVLEVIPDEATRRELVSALAQLQLAQRPTSAVVAPAGQRVAGAVKGGSANEPPGMGDFLNALEKRLDKRLGPAQPEAAPRKRQTKVERRKR